MTRIISDSLKNNFCVGELKCKSDLIFTVFYLAVTDYFGFWKSSNSTSKIRVEFGGMSPGKPRGP